MQHIAAIPTVISYSKGCKRKRDTRLAEGREKPSPVEFTGTAHACQRAVTTCMKLGLLGRFIRDRLLTAAVRSSR